MRSKPAIVFFTVLFLSLLPFMFLPEVHAESLPSTVEAAFDDFWSSTRLADKYRKRVFSEFEDRFSMTYSALADKDSYLGESLKIGSLSRVKEYFESKLTERGESTSEVLIHLGNVSFLEYNIEEALDYYIKAVVVEENLSTLEIIAETFLISGNYEESAKYFEKSVDVLNAKGQKFSQQSASLQSRAVVSYMLADDLGMSLKYALEAFEIYLLLRGNADSVTGEAAITVGEIYFQLDDMERSQEYFTKALGIFLRIERGDTGLKVAQVLNHIGLSYFYSGFYDDSLKQFKKVIVIRERILGKNHPGVAEAYNNVAEAFVKLGYLHEAMAYYRLAYGIYKSVDELDGVEIAAVLHRMGGMFYFMGNIDESLHYLNRSLSLYRSIRGEDHPEVAAILNNIGSIYYSMERYSDAEQMFEKAMAIFVGRYGEGHLSVADALSNIGLSLKEQHRYEEAGILLEKGLKVRRDNLGENHPDFISSLDFLGEINERVGKAAEAVKQYKESIEIKKRVYGPQSVEVAEGIARVAFLLWPDNRSEAVKYFREARNLLIQSGREDHPLVFAIQPYLVNAEIVSANGKKEK